jgi:phospholipase C
MAPTRLRRARWLALMLSSLVLTSGLSDHAHPALALPQPVAQAATASAQELVDLRSHIKHVVVMIQENHTFGNVLGDGCARTSRCRGLRIGSKVRLSNGAVVTLKGATDKVPETDHSFASQQAAWNGGRNDAWQRIGGCGGPNYGCMSSYAPEQIPALWSLATHFALSDNTYTCNPVTSWGDHFSWQTACNLDGFAGSIPLKTSGAGPTWGCRSKRVEPWSATGRPPYRLEPACNPDPSLTAPNGGAFRPTPVRSIRTFGENCDRASSCTRASYNTALIWSTDEAHAYLAYHHNIRRSTTQFLADAQSGQLPGLSILTPAMPGGETSQHNGASMAVGDRGIRTALSAVMNGPQWNSTAVFITYDDCGCFYDSVAPNRVPLVIVSPWAKPGYVDSTRVTFAGVQAFIENVFGLPRLNGADASAYTFGKAFTFSQAALHPIALPLARIPTSSRVLARATYRADPDDPS